MFELPSDRRLLTAADAAREAMAAPGGFALVGAAGSGPALIARALLQSGVSQVLYVAPSTEGALRAAEDLRALALLPLRGLEPAPDEPPPLVLASSETSPYAEVHPDRRQTMQRAAALFTMARGLPWRTAVATPSSLLRRAAPPEALLRAGLELVTDAELDVERTAHVLTEAGYLRTPVVEDPGGFAVRGGVIDVWPSNAVEPVRVELLGDMILSLKRFDPDTQRTTAELRSAWLPPAREAILDATVVDRARASLRHLCDEASFPSTKARALIDDLVFGRSFFGSEGYLPAFYELVPLLSYLPAGAAVVFEDPPAVAKALVLELQQAKSAEAARGSHPHYPVEALFATLDELEQSLHGRVWVGAHRAGIAGTGAGDLVARLESAPPDAPSVAQDDHAELARAVKLARTAQGKHAALEPLAERIREWQERGLSVVPIAKTATQAERIGNLLKHRGLELAVTVAPLGRGCVAPLEGVVLVTDEEIFGPRALRAPARRTSTRALLEDLRALSPGDHVVHVEHGIGKYLGLERREVAGVGLELIVVEYAGGKLFLPVYRLNQIQKYSGGEGAPKLDRLGGQTFAKTKQSVERKVRQMADELLRLYAERRAAGGDALATADDDYRAFEATFPFDETPDQACAIADVDKDLETPAPMDRL
ncbi:MAG TPA: CarD family transcriptional regulator, partial [Polyangiaceae bacterium]|nr:CarD family transcriptional regulator [Polyangiaceae bacterium]